MSISATKCILQEFIAIFEVVEPDANELQLNYPRSAKQQKHRTSTPAAIQYYVFEEISSYHIFSRYQ
jgi:hypothetical protein